MRVAMTGSRGLIGSALMAALNEQGHSVVAIARGKAAPTAPGVEIPQRSGLFFDPDGGPGDLGALEGFDAVIHLAGEPIGDRRWNAQIRSRIYASRVYGTRSVVDALGRLKDPPATLLVASAIGVYGDRGSEELTETSVTGSGFLAKVVTDWEAESHRAKAFAHRVVTLRTGVVLATRGGLLARLLPLFRAGLGGRLGAGAQYMSWISLADEVRAILHCLETDSIQGPVNLVAPNPVTNLAFTKHLAKALHRPAIFTVPAGVIEAVLGAEMARELALASQRVKPEVLGASGFAFDSELLDVALARLLAPRRGSSVTG
ncbi:TIGR01777 family oxidoreductase [Ferrimicrobium sp.]|uniref:TIGR01777 family oxidoreductase n=1 Tax=Ferrimicrobium sp. TaxID=2926050 RepID=UPI002634C16C|nr:TIGR01777 family oxidoreductase [Ferrimicrobium sp.]